MTDQPFKVGDVVTLKSGGLPMTVEGMNEDDVSVAWTDDAGTVKVDKFSRNALKIYNPELAIGSMSGGESVVSDKSFWRKLASAAKKAGREAIEKALTVYYVYCDPDTPPEAKNYIRGALAYFIIPLDALPDFMAAVGYTDDLGVLVAAIAAVAQHIKPEHAEKAEYWVNRNFGPKS
ncbi:MAG: DUF2158 domain-containing protein [Rhodobacteraceae bacterium]|nr:DUF2158 domain-containing protein [Paracoccaceae bacterium]